MQRLQYFSSPGGIGQLHFAAKIKPLHNLLHIHTVEVVIVSLGNGGPNQFPADMVGALHLTFILQFEFAGNRRQRGVHISNARNNNFFVAPNGPALGVGNHILHA